jgi:4-hydroxy-3-polyprenylbenzoate decarboxylase
LDNVFKGKDVDIEKIPTPVWHEHDGGPYIGTGCLVAMKDPDSGWINYGTYRVQSHERNVASVMMSPGKHGLIIMRKYHERGEPCPVAVVAGMHPVLMMLGGIEIPYGRTSWRQPAASSASQSRSSTCRRPACRCRRMRRSPSKA